MNPNETQTTVKASKLHLKILQHLAKNPFYAGMDFLSPGNPGLLKTIINTHNTDVTSDIYNYLSKTCAPWAPAKSTSKTQVPPSKRPNVPRVLPKDQPQVSAHMTSSASSSVPMYTGATYTPTMSQSVTLTEAGENWNTFRVRATGISPPKKQCRRRSGIGIHETDLCIHEVRI